MVPWSLQNKDFSGGQQGCCVLDLLHQPLWQIDMTHDLLKQELFQDIITSKRKSLFLRVSLYASAETFVFELDTFENHSNFSLVSLGST